MRAHLTKLVTMVALFAAVSACSHATKNGGDEGDLRPTTRVHVENRAYNDANIFVIADGGNRQRLGTVTGNSNADFTIPDYFITPANSVSFRIEPIGSNSAGRSNTLSVQPGQTVTLEINSF
jgi:hypothetical protein